ncbi:hypothetical protein HY501_03750 [Candidatus Woesearchaeota archaeon]|nr:hypothetical protein [Candidatus Woesearchaeota archaeon]
MNKIVSIGAVTALVLGVYTIAPEVRRLLNIVNDENRMTHYVKQGETLNEYAYCEGLNSWHGYDRRAYYSNIIGASNGHIETGSSIQEGDTLRLPDINNDNRVGCE